MNETRWRFWAVSSVLLIAVLAALILTLGGERAAAQQPGQPPLGGFPAPGLQGPGPAFPPLMGPVAMVANNDFVYILRGNTLYQIGAADLKIIGKIILEEEPPSPPGVMPSMPGVRPGSRGRAGSPDSSPPAQP